MTNLAVTGSANHWSSTCNGIDPLTIKRNIVLPQFGLWLGDKQTGNITVSPSFPSPHFCHSSSQTPDQFRLGWLPSQRGQTPHRLAQPQVNLYLHLYLYKPKHPVLTADSTCLVLIQNKETTWLYLEALHSTLILLDYLNQAITEGAQEQKSKTEISQQTLRTTLEEEI